MNAKPNHIYLISLTVRGIPVYKIGVTSNPKDRFRNLSSQYCCEIVPIKVIKVNASATLLIEDIVHRHFRQKKCKVNYSHEMFSLDQSDIDDFENIVANSNRNVKMSFAKWAK